MAKNKQEITKIVKITIEAYPKNPHTWQFKTEIGHGQEKKTEKTICPKDIFDGAITNYTTLINALRMLNYAVEPTRKHVKDILKQMEEERKNPPIQQIPPKKLSRHEVRQIQRTQKDSLQKAKGQITFLSTATDALRKNLSSEGMLEKIALALALTETVTFEDIEKEINSKSHRYEIELPITKYPDLSSMQTQQSGQLMSMIDSVLSIGGSLAKGVF